MEMSRYDEPEHGKDFLTELKEAVDKQAELAAKAFEGLDEASRAELEGYRIGTYVRIVIENVPCELVECFNSRVPYIVGALQSSEETLGYVQVPQTPPLFQSSFLFFSAFSVFSVFFANENLQIRIKKHRWYKKILKNNDPLIFSVGWRRFQSIPMYSIEDRGKRNRMLKYTPQHMHCNATFWGPTTPPGTGLLGFQTLSNEFAGFRVAAT
jgi:ribosome biogenesis protein BMS1